MKRAKILSVVLAGVLLLTGCSEDIEPQSSKKDKDNSSISENNGAQDEPYNYPQDDIMDDIDPEPIELGIWDVLPYIDETPASAFEYSYDSKSEGMIVTNYLNESPKIRIPDKLEGEPVVRVNLSECKKELTEVIIPDTVKSFVFSYSTQDSIKYINHPRDKETVSFSQYDSLEAVYIPDGTTSFAKNAFLGCDSLASINIPESVTDVSYDAFDGCKNLTDINVIGKNPKYYSINGFLYERGDSGEVILSKCPIGKSGSITISDEVTEIGKYAFDGCTNVTSVTIPDTVAEIGTYAFRNCTSLTSIAIPDSVIAIYKGKNGMTKEGMEVFLGDGSIFAGCEKIQVTYKGKIYDYNHMAWLYDAVQLGGHSIIVENGVLTDVSLELTELVIPDSVTEIDGAAFYACTNLTSVTIPDSVTKIGRRAFVYCTSLSSITIPDSVTEIDESAFDYCTSLTSATYKGKTYDYEHIDELYKAINGN